MRYFLIAGEASGDLHASRLIAQLKERDDAAEFRFLGGDMMAAAAGVAPVIDYRQMAFMGFSAVISHLPTVMRNLKTAREELKAFRPDCLILIDYPSFNLKVAKTAKQLGIKVFYYISPKVWAWKEHRVRTIKKLVDRMFTIFPFETEFYKTRHDYDVTYVGNPSVSEIDKAVAEAPSREDFLAAHRYKNRPIVALLPGSRLSEIRNNLSVMCLALKQFPQYQPIVAAAPGIDDEVYAAYPNLRIVRDETITLLKHSRAALVTSGTATLEAALVGTPQVACYRANGSRLSYEIMKRLLKVKYVTLPNLIADRQVIDELLLHFCTADNIAASLAAILPEREARETMLNGYADIRRALGEGDAAARAADEMVKALGVKA